MGRSVMNSVLSGLLFLGLGRMAFDALRRHAGTPGKASTRAVEVLLPTSIPCTVLVSQHDGPIFEANGIV